VKKLLKIYYQILLNGKEEEIIIMNHEYQENERQKEDERINKFGMNLNFTTKKCYM
jgi:hypothetical protein